jgi:peptidoglycan/LPS O-acetylase OafA/YrhL
MNERGVKVADLLKRDANIFDSLRLFAATLVIFSHSYALAGFHEPQLQGISLGALGVRIFFILSGLLIAASWVSHPRVGAYLGKRALRILPALIAIIFVTVFIIGPLFTTVGLREYFSRNDTYAYLNGISIFGLQLDLPGVFFTNPFGGVNGSLWTLPYEVSAYLLVAFLGRTYLLKKKPVTIALYLLCVAVFVFTNHWATGLILFTLNVHLLAIFWGFFLAGVLLYLYRDRIVLTPQGAFIAFLLIMVSIPTNHFQLLSFFALPYLVLYVGSLTSTGLGRLSRYGDFSYGMYIYAWPIQQSIVALHNGHISHKRLFVLSFAATFFVSVLSWYRLEKPMLKLKAYFNVERYPLLRDAW